MAWRVRVFTVDDAYISYRFARNFARGDGLVYNVGERVEGYTNFLWTVLLGFGIKLGIDPDLLAKLMGVMAGAGTLVCIYFIAGRLSKFERVPCLATWLYATSITATGYAVWGMETALFTLGIMLGLLLTLRERDEPERFPWSGLVFAGAALTRPEAVMFVAVIMAFMGRRALERQNVRRALLFVLPVLIHLAWRHAYYGAWLPNTFAAKTGDIELQFSGGIAYLKRYVLHQGLLPVIGLWAGAKAISQRDRTTLTLVACWCGLLVYILLVGGDWMPFFRFFGPGEPFVWLLVGLSIRRVWEGTDKRGRIGMAIFLTIGSGQRVHNLIRAQEEVLEHHEPLWRQTWGATAEWLAQQPRGTVAIGDMGVVGYVTDYPILDTLGLVDPVISELPGGYTQKIGPGYVERFFEVRPRYAVMSPGDETCERLYFPADRDVVGDARFSAYALAATPGHEFGQLCVFGLRD
jgi:hypothetical protein